MSGQRVVVITGGSGALGSATAKRFAAGGDDVWVGYNEGAERADAVVKQITADGGIATAVKLNLIDDASVVAGLDTIVGARGPIGVLINNAGIRPIGRFLTLEDEAWETVLGVNLLGAMRCARFAIPGMLEKGWGRIINISGTDAFWGWGDRPHVTVSKAGLLGLTRAIAAEFAGTGITANSLVPGPFDTPRKQEWYPEWIETRAYVTSRIPVGREGRPEEFAEWCWFLASEAAAFVTGQDIHVNGGAYPLVRNPNVSYETGPN